MNTKQTGPLIAAAAAAGAAIGSGLAQIPGSDSGPLSAIETALVVAIARAHGVDLANAAATDLVLTLSASLVGRSVSAVLLGWIPGWGNALNATTAAAVVTAVGYAADVHFASLAGGGQ